MQQIHLFDIPLRQRIEEMIGEPVEKYFVTSSNLVDPVNNYRTFQCKALSKKNVYILYISEDERYDSLILHEVERKKLNKNFIQTYFEKYQ